MTKNPFEIRLELLAMAQAILNEQHINERIKAENDWSLEREKASTRISAGDQNVYMPPFPEVKPVSPDAIIALADKLNGFVSKN